MFNLKRTPSINSGKLWMLKLGYYNITKKQTMADDWIRGAGFLIVIYKKEEEFIYPSQRG